jgi:hypothetical protein
MVLIPWNRKEDSVYDQSLTARPVCAVEKVVPRILAELVIQDSKPDYKIHISYVFSETATCTGTRACNNQGVSLTRTFRPARRSRARSPLEQVSEPASGPSSCGHRHQLAHELLGSGRRRRGHLGPGRYHVYPRPRLRPWVSVSGRDALGDRSAELVDESRERLADLYQQGLP